MRVTPQYSPQDYGAFLLRVLLGCLFIAHLYWKLAIFPGGLAGWWSGLTRNGYPVFVPAYVLSAEILGAALLLPGMGEHHARSSHHRASTHHRKSTHHRATRVHPAAHKRHSTRAHHSNARFSTRTVRNCHRMTYKRIMRDNLCRAMMTQDLKKRRTRHHASKHRHAAHHRASAHHRRKPHHA